MKTPSLHSLTCSMIPAFIAILLSGTGTALAFSSGDGSIDNPYQVVTAEHLDAVRNDLAGHYVQTTDIDLGIAPWNDGVGWIPIGGTDAGARFTGSYDGGGFAIRNLKINRPALTHVGLFRYLDGAAIRNVSLENADVRGSTNTGALAGYANASLIEQVGVTGAVLGGGECGGVFGRAHGGNIAGASYSGTVQGGTNTGGVVGQLSGLVRMRHASATGTVTGSATVGGVVGYIDQSEISDCYSRADVTAVAGGNTGGLIGYVYYGAARRGYSTGAVSATGSYVGGLVGRQFSSVVSDGHWDIESSGLETSAGGTGLPTTAMRSQITYHNFNFSNLWQIAEGEDYPLFRPLSGHAQPLGLLPDVFAGLGTAEEPYLITTEDELDAMRHAPAAHYRLANDIDLAATVVWNAGLGWSPIGPAAATPFTGSLDGAGFAIRNLTINRPSSNYQGLFGYLSGARVINLWIEDANVHGSAFSGILAGHAQAAVLMNLRASGEVTGQADSGGLFGRMAAGNLAHAAFTGKVKGTGNVGGLAGSIAGGADVRYGSSSGEARGSSNVGGLVGYLDQAMVADSHSRAAVRGGSSAGGFVGYIYYASSWRCLSTGSVTGTGSNVGGFLGGSFSSTVSDCYWDVLTSGQVAGPSGGGKTSAEMKQRATFLNFNFNTAWSVDEGIDYPLHQELAVLQEPAAVHPDDLDGEGTAGSPYLVSNAAELAVMRLAPDAHFKLTNDIDLASTAMWDFGRGWQPVGASPVAERFRGSLDGGGFAIRNLTIQRPTTGNQGLFGYLDGARIHDLRIENASVRGGTNTGILAGLAGSSTMENITAGGEVTGTTGCGGMIGRQDGGNLANASFTGTVQGGSNVGGLVGQTTGGATIRHAHSDGRVLGSSSVGGLIGYHYGHTLADSCSHAAVSGASNVGGLIGYFYYSTAYRSFSTGPVSGTGASVGGLVGGSFSSTAQDCYWDSERSSLESSVAGTPRTTGEMFQRATFFNYNFHTVWRIHEGQGYPALRFLGGQASPAAVALEDLAGNGSAESPYIVTNAGELNAMHLNRSAHFALANDIDLAAAADWHSGQGWLPVGSSSAGQRFSGTLDGAGFTIRNLTINRPTTTYQGLFGYLENATIRNLRIETAAVRGAQFTGSLAGYAATSLVENVRAAGEVTGGNDCGGLIGRLHSGNLSNVAFEGTVQGGANVGGVLGHASGTATVRHGFSTGRVHGNSTVGGFVGYHYGATIADCFSQTDVVGGTHAGGFAGYIYYSSTWRCFSTGAVSGTGTRVGGFVGYVFSGTASDCFWDIESSMQESSAGGEGSTSAAMRDRATFANYNFNTLWRIDEGVRPPAFQELAAHAHPATVMPAVLPGLGTIESPYLIANAAQLNAMRHAPAAHFQLVADVDLAATVVWNDGQGWLPTGTSSAGFTGVLDGNGHAIRNLTVNRPTTTYQGLFGYANGATISNLRIENATVRGAQYSGALAGSTNNTGIENVVVSGEVSGTDACGGLAGRQNGGATSQSSFTGSVRGTTNTGGLVGHLSGASTVAECYAVGSVRGTSTVGGLVGYHYGNHVLDSYSRAAVSGTGGSVGGFAGYLYYSTTSRCYSTGLVTSPAQSNVGGFVGNAFSSTTNHCHWDTESSHMSNSAGGTGSSTSQMKQEGTYHSSWSFPSVWQIAENLSYPEHSNTAQAVGVAPPVRYHHNGSSTGHVAAVVANSAWTAATAETWITITAGSSGRDNGAVLYSLAVNPLPVARHGVITVTATDGGSRDFHVHQEALLGISPALAAHDAPASSGHAVHVSGNVAWAAQASESWIQITSGASGADDGLLVYAITENYGLDPRVGTITISGGSVDRVVQIHQGGAAQYLGISPAWLEHPAEGAAGQVITVTANTAWSAVSDSLWITLVGGSSGTGNGSVVYQVAAGDAHAPRVGHVTVSDGSRSLQHRVFQVPQGSVRIDIVDAPSGTGFFTGFGRYRAGERVTLDAWNSASHAFVSWSDGTGVVSTHPQFVFTAQEPRTLTANYEPRVHTLTYLATEDGSIHGNPQQFVQHGGDGSPVHAIPNPGHVFVEWSDGVTANPRTDTNVSSDIEVTALFVVVPEGHHSLVYRAGPGGSIAGEPVQVVEAGASGTPVVAVPDEDHFFMQWSDGVLTAERLDTGVGESIEVVAEFARSRNTLVYLAGEGGMIDGPTPQTVDHGEDGEPVTAVADTGWLFVQWSDGGTKAERQETNVTGSREVTAEFARVQYTLEYSAGEGGSIDGPTPQMVDHGEDGEPVTAVALSGWVFVQWNDGVTIATRQDTGVLSNIDVVAQFEEDQEHSSVAIFADGPEMPIARMGHQFATLPDGRVALFGGHGQGFAALSSANFWTPGQEAFTSKQMNQVRSWPIFLRLADGRYLLAGGSGNLGVPNRADSEIYDPVSDTFTPSGSMVRFRSGSGGAALADGRALIAGAWWTHNTAHTYGELFNPSTSSYAAVGPFGVARSHAIVMPMADGSGVVVGGSQPNGSSADMPVERYNPENGAISVLQTLLFPDEPGWRVGINWNQSTFAQKTADGRYLWMATRSESGVTHYRLFTFDPGNGSIAALPLQQPLPDSSSGWLTPHVLVDAARNRAHILVQVAQTSGTPAVEVITIDTISGAMVRSSNSHLPGYSLSGSGMQVLTDGRIFVTGGSADGSNFNPVRNTFLITPPALGSVTLSYHAGAGGSILGDTPQTVEPGESGGTIFALADDGAEFQQWSDGSTINPRIDGHVTGSIRVTAYFRSAGGVYIDWYAGHGILPGEGQTWADLDGIDWLGKGMTLQQEFLAKTDPNDSLSGFATDAPVRVGTAVEIHFHPSSPNRRYTLWRTTELVEWHRVAGQIGIPGGNGAMVDADPPEPSAFYRIEVSLP